MTVMSCSDDSEILEPTVGYVDNKFAVPADATGPEADLRRDFYASTGTNLLFSEILDREYVGLDAFGEEVWKEHKIDFTYNLTSKSDIAPEFTEYDDLESKRQAAEFIKQYILPHIEGSSYGTFSFLAVKSLKKPKSSWSDVMVDGTYVSCWRCMALAIGNVADMTDDEKKALALSQLKDIVGDRFDEFSNDMKVFNDMSEEYHYERLINYDPDWDRSDMSVVYELGYLTYTESYMGSHRDYVSYYSDFDDYFDVVMTRDEADFMAEFGDYARVVTKYNVIKSCILKDGYKF